MTNLRVALFVIAFCGLAIGNLIADDTLNSYDSMRQHPYAFMPGYAHASLSPGSPKHFRPGYGYRVTDFGNSTAHYSHGSSYLLNYRNGIRIDRVTAYGYFHSPWYLPGAPTSSSVGWPKW